MVNQFTVLKIPIYASTYLPLTSIKHIRWNRSENTNLHFQILCTQFTIGGGEMKSFYKSMDAIEFSLSWDMLIVIMMLMIMLMKLDEINTALQRLPQQYKELKELHTTALETENTPSTWEKHSQRGNQLEMFLCYYHSNVLFLHEIHF